MGHGFSNATDGNIQLRTIPEDNNADSQAGVNMKDFYIKQIIGSGQTSEVYLVKKKGDIQKQKSIQNTDCPIIPIMKDSTSSEIKSQSQNFGDLQVNNFARHYAMKVIKKGKIK